MDNTLYNDNELSSIMWLDDCVKHIYFFENIVLRRAKYSSNFTEQEMVDMIGWVVALDNIWDNESMGWKLKELQYGARNKAEIEWIEKSDSDIIHTKVNTKYIAENPNQSDNNKPSKRVIKQLLNNLRLQHSSLDKLLKLAAEHIPALNLTDSYITILLQQRDELKAMLKMCLSSLTADDQKTSCSNSEANIFAELLGILVQDDINTKISERDKKPYCTDSYQKDLLSLAIVADKNNHKKLSRISTEIQVPWRITKHLASKILSSTNITNKKQIDLLTWLDNIIFGDNSTPALSTQNIGGLKQEGNISTEHSHPVLRTGTERKEFFLSLNVRK